MKYFIYNNQRNGTCYHEFYKGKWDGKTFWKTDSILLDDEVLTKGLVEAIIKVVPTYDPYGITEISNNEWNQIGNIVITKDLKSQEIYNEADKWLKDVFSIYDCFTILGI